MTMRNARWLALALSAALVAGSGLRGDEEKDDLEKMQGTWISKGPAEGRDESQWVFSGKELKVTSPKRNYDTTISIDPTTKPKQIDFKIDKGPSDAEGKTSLGIYKFDDDDDELMICIGGEPNYRPEEFKEQVGKSYLFELKLKD